MQLMVNSQHIRLLRCVFAGILLVNSLFFFRLNAQDIYLSHFDAAPQYLNPSLAGQYFGERNDFRVNGNFSGQSFGSFSNQYTTMALGYDFPVNKFGVGYFVINSRAGEGHYNILNLLVSGSYEISVDRRYRHNLLTGVQFGLMNHSFNQEKLFFANQYNPATGGFDASQASGENFNTTSLMMFDAGLGALYDFRDRRKPFNPFLGFSIFHATNPRLSFYDADYFYPLRFTIYSGIGINLSEFFQLSPRFLIIHQGKKQNMDAGVFSFYRIPYTKYEMITGLLVNSNDNITVHGGIKINNAQYRLSYGFNSFIEQQITTSRNMIELSVVFSKPSNVKASF